MQKSKLLCVLCFVIVLSNFGIVSAYSGYSLTPSQFDVEYVPGQTYELSLTASGNSGYEVVKVVTGGELAGYIVPEQDAVTLVNGVGTVKFKFTVPEINTPGLHKGFVGIEQLPPETLYGQEPVVAVVRIFSAVFVNVPCEGKCANLELVTSNVAVGEKAFFQAKLTNLGKETISKAEGSIQIGNDYVLPLTSVSEITAGQTQILRAEWDTTNVIPGRYIANATVFFDGYATSDDIEINVGKFALEFIGISASDIVQNQTAKISVNVRSIWNEDIAGVFADVFIYDKNNMQIYQSKTPGTAIASWSNVGLLAYWDTIGAPLGNYTIRANVHYADQVISGEGKINVVVPQGILSGYVSPTAISSIILLIVIIALMLLLIKKRKQR